MASVFSEAASPWWCILGRPHGIGVVALCGTFSGSKAVAGCDPTPRPNNDRVPRATSLFRKLLSWRYALRPSLRYTAPLLGTVLQRDEFDGGSDD
jgi:hypothetical protein